MNNPDVSRYSYPIDEEMVRPKLGYESEVNVQTFVKCLFSCEMVFRSVLWAKCSIVWSFQLFQGSDSPWSLNLI